MSALGNFASLGSRGMASIADQVATAAISFVVSIYIGRKLGADALGLYAITNVLVMLIRALQSSILLEPMSVFGPRRSAEDYPRYFGFLVSLQGTSILLFSVLVAASVSVFYAYGAIELNLFQVMLMSCGYVNFLCFQYLIRRQFYVELRQYKATIQAILFLSLVMTGLALLWQVDGVSVVDIYAMMTLCSGLVCITQGGRFWRKVAMPTRAEVRTYAGEHWSYGRWILLAVPFAILLYHGFFAFVGLALSPEAAGLLKAADTFIAPFVQIVIGMQMMLVPMASRNADTMSIRAQQRLALRVSLMFLAVSIAYASFVYFFGEWALILVFGEKMREAVPLLAILVFLPLVRGLPVGAGIILSSRKRAELRFIGQVSASVLTVATCVPLIYYAGLTGAAIGMVLSQVIYAGCLWACTLWLWRQDRALAAAPAI